MFINAPKVDSFASEASENKSIRFAYIGRVGVEKGLETIGEAIQNSPHEVVVAGEVTDHERESLSASYPGLRFVGVVKTSEFLPKVRNVIVPSKWREPFGRVVVEAGLAGARVVISDQPGLKEAARSIGLNASVFPAGDAPRLRAIMDEIADQPAQALHFTSIESEQQPSLLDAVDYLLNDRDSSASIDR
ncbi:glycosyltransferase [Arenivirga flava]|uniref:Glycosyl transferase family 1 domain-containing protein n=1 Tax=Arenivirga flava TaxID=1930060 RepID=A0AA37UIZ9_9MICO|nr:glycosyltransferase [Arenivirga flava]GMA28062.1 hypothetical protein GCM10025874_13150 [Arenivirga flava]